MLGKVKFEKCQDVPENINYPFKKGDTVNLLIVGNHNGKDIIGISVIEILDTHDIFIGKKNETLYKISEGNEYVSLTFPYCLKGYFSSQFCEKKIIVCKLGRTKIYIEEAKNETV